MKKIGYSALFTCIAAAMCAYYVSRKRIDFQNKLNYFSQDDLVKSINKNPVVNPEYKFLEFFEKKNIKEAYSRYEEYLDLGLANEDAFKAVVEDGRNT